MESALLVSRILPRVLDGDVADRLAIRLVLVHEVVVVDMPDGNDRRRATAELPLALKLGLQIRKLLRTDLGPRLRQRRSGWHGLGAAPFAAVLPKLSVPGNPFAAWPRAQQPRGQRPLIPAGLRAETAGLAIEGAIPAARAEAHRTLHRR